MHAVDIVLREARRLHRAAASPSLETALPVLRRLLAARVLPMRTLPECHRLRARVQRKHLLRMLAIEAGCAQWDDWRSLLVSGAAAAPDYATARDVGRLKHWFVDPSDAVRHAAGCGGTVVCIGGQAAVVAPVAVSAPAAGCAAAAVISAAAVPASRASEHGHE